MRREAGFVVVALACALGAATLTFMQSARAGDSSGPSAAVLVNNAPLSAGAIIDERAAAALTPRRMPKALVPPDALNAAADAAGMRVRIDLPAGSLLTRSLLFDAAGADAVSLRPGERAVTVDVVPSPNSDQLSVGRQVDLFASGVGGSQRTAALISAAEILALDDSSGSARPKITVRLSARQVAAVIRADVFARELRAVAVPQRSR
jgi:hypothetical protein